MGSGCWCRPLLPGAAPSLRESLHGWLVSGTRPPSWAQLRSALRCQAAASREEAVAVAPCTLEPGGAGLQGPPALPRAGPSQPLELSRQGDPQHGLLARRRLPGVWSRALSLPRCDVGRSQGSPLPEGTAGLPHARPVAHTGTSRPRYSGFSAVGVPSKVLGGDPRSAGSWSQ